MSVLSQGEIKDQNATVFRAVASTDGARITVRFEGTIRVDNPSRHLATFLRQLPDMLATQTSLTGVLLDFTGLRFCNSNGFYVIMDIVEAVYRTVSARVVVRRLKSDDWHQETLPILLNIDEEAVASRTVFEDV